MHAGEPKPHGFDLRPPPFPARVLHHPGRRRIRGYQIRARVGDTRQQGCIRLRGKPGHKPVRYPAAGTLSQFVQPVQGSPGSTRPCREDRLRRRGLASALRLLITGRLTFSRFANAPCDPYPASARARWSRSASSSLGVMCAPPVTAFRADQLPDYYCRLSSGHCHVWKREHFRTLRNTIHGHSYGNDI